MRYVWLLCLYLLLPGAAQAGERILALAPHVCEILFAIGAGEDIVGAVDYCDYPEQARTVTRIGNYRRVNVEAALRLHPTLAISMDRSMPGLDMLASQGVRVAESYPHDVDGMIDDVVRLGQLTGHRQAAERLADTLHARLEHLRAARGRPVSVFYEIWGDPLITPGGRSFISALLREIGAHNVFDRIAMDTSRINVESVVQAAPKVVIVPTEARDVAQRRAFWRRWLGEDVHVIVVDHDLIHRPGPRLLDGMEYLAAQLRQVIP